MSLDPARLARGVTGRLRAMTSVLWFRRDLRLRDHPALHEAAEGRAGGGAVRARPGAAEAGRRAPRRIPVPGAARTRRRPARARRAAGRAPRRPGERRAARGARGRARLGPRQRRLRPVRTRARRARSSTRSATSRSSAPARRTRSRPAGYARPTASRTRSTRRSTAPGASTAGAARRRRSPAGSTGTRRLDGIDDPERPARCPTASSCPTPARTPR